ncbi:MAG: AbrB/MazE/SpoVT family DNA-binding domain-containing protein [Candidatus Methanoperedens sp.]
MEEEILTMSGKGQVVIPARVRRYFGLRKGDKLMLEIDSRSIKMIPKTVDITTLVGSIKGIDIEAVTKAIINDREDDGEREKQIKRAVKNIKKT